ncbi:F10B6.16 [Arabidopsis thaliana]|nr:F10B6.16 [Arabidopsis thaliana]
MDVKKDENSILENMKQEINHSLKEEAQEEEEILKKRISSHPFINVYLLCIWTQPRPELDQFMVLFFFSPCQNIFTQQKTTFHEAYCSTLRELKEAMEKPLTETHRFVDAVYTQLNDIVMSSPP